MPCRCLIRPLLILLVAYVLRAPAALDAAELHFANGDVISGDFLRRAEGKIYFRSPVLGDIVVPADQAVVVETSETPVESLAGLPPEQNRQGETVSSAKRATSPTPWHGTIELGYQQQSGRQESLTSSLRATAQRKHLVDDYRAEVRALYGKQDGVTNTDRYDGSFRWRHELSSRTFGQSQTSFTKDSVKGIDKNYEENIGSGLRLYERPRFSANIGAGLTAQYREATGVKPGLSYYGEAFQDFTYKLNGRVTLSEDSSLLYGLSNRGRQVDTDTQTTETTYQGQDYRVRFGTTLQGKITERISMNLRFEYEFDSAIALASARADKRITTSIGYGF